jgi:hypothetical protein
MLAREDTHSLPEPRTRRLLNRQHRTTPHDIGRSGPFQASWPDVRLLGIVSALDRHWTGTVEMVCSASHRGTAPGAPGIVQRER